MIKKLIRWFQDRKKIQFKSHIKDVMLVKTIDHGMKFCIHLMKISKKRKF